MCLPPIFCFFFFNDTATTEIYTLSLHDALPISPGVNPLAAGLAGVVGLRPASFLLYAAAGALLWAGAWIMLGYLCADVIAVIATWTARFRMPLVIGTAVALSLYIAIKYAMRRRFLGHLQKVRIDPIELKRRMEAGDPMAIVVDLRTELDIETTP